MRKTEAETDIRPILGVLYTQLRKTGISHTAAFQMALTLITNDLWRMYAIRSLDEMIIDRLDAMDVMISKTMRPFRLLNVASSFTMAFFWTWVIFHLR